MAPIPLRDDDEVDFFAIVSCLPSTLSVGGQRRSSILAWRLITAPTPKTRLAIKNGHGRVPLTIDTGYR